MVIRNNASKIIVAPNEHNAIFQLVSMYVAAPTDHPDLASETKGRPFEFDADIPIKFSVMCPFCCAGLYVESANITDKYGYKFIGCTNCGVGLLEPITPIPAFIDPFINPFTSKQLTRCDLDEVLTPVDNIPDDGMLTVAEKMAKLCVE